eukprot:902649-Rhodomonas_salina.1
MVLQGVACHEGYGAMKLRHWDRAWCYEIAALRQDMALWNVAVANVWYYGVFIRGIQSLEYRAATCSDAEKPCRDTDDNVQMTLAITCDATGDNV